MGDGPLCDVTHAERRELDALRRRAYGPAADIFDDAPALARLVELEDRVRLARRTAEPEPVAVEPRVPALADPSATSRAVAPPIHERPAPSKSASRRRLTVMAGAAGAAIVLGAIAWSGTSNRPAGEPAAGHAKTAAEAKAQRVREYRMYIDGLRDEVLSLPGGGAVADRMIRDQLRPYGTLYGRTVGAGPTSDHRFCMIIADEPDASITCISVENAYANPASVTLPLVGGDAGGAGELVSYTLMPGGSVVAVPTGSPG